jgi:ferredoxin-fold anticodon binding domain-containing protein
MPMQHIENMMRRYRGQTVNIKTISGGVYEGTVAEVTSDYVALVMKGEGNEREQVCVMFHSIESVLPRGVA